MSCYSIVEGLKWGIAKSNFVEVYDTTLRDGAQAKDVNFSLQDKLRISVGTPEQNLRLIKAMESLLQA